MSESTNPEQDFIANKEQREKFLEKRKVIETYYSELVAAHQNEHQYVKIMAEMAEYDLRNKMAILKLAQLEAELQRNKEAGEDAKKPKADA